MQSSNNDNSVDIDELNNKVALIKQNNIPAVIKKFISEYNAGRLSMPEIELLQQELFDFSDNHSHITDLTASRLFEYNAILQDAMGLARESRESIGIAESYLPKGKSLLTEWSEKIAQNRSKNQLNSPSEPKAQKQAGYIKPKQKYKAKVILLVIAIGVFFVWQPVADWYATASATPEQKSLADSLDLTSKGRQIFLSAKPEVLDAEDFSQVCSSDSGGGLEEGCYLPSDNRIYIRSMPEELKSEETVIAAHEMLHAAYQRLSDSKRNRVNQLVEAAYSSMGDSDLTKLIGEYSSSEPGQQDNELHSFLGSEYSNLGTDLENYYGQYFASRQIETDAHQETTNTFNNYSSTLDTQQQNIKQEENLANNYYSSSVAAANNGDAYYDDYYYNLYSQEYQNASRDIDAYNALVDKYNLLVEEYSGNSYSAIPTPQQQSQ